MDWADELAASVSGPQVVNDSKTPSGTVHLGSLRGPVILDTIWRALRARGLDAQLLYGIDDYDPMDAQALLTPDAVEREMGRPLVPGPGPGRRLPRVLRPALRRALHRHLPGARHPSRALLLDERHLPDGRDGPVHPDRAQPGGDGPRDLPPRRERPAPRRAGIRSRSSARTAARSGRRSSPTGTASWSSTSAGRSSSPGRPAAATPAGCRRSAAGRSCRGTSSGRPSGRCSG